MLTPRGFCLQLLLVCGFLTMGVAASGQDAPVSEALVEAKAAAVATYPEIVRIRAVDGDVRISRVKVVEHETGDAWEQAVADLPLETGYSLTTGDGRAEIEFEDNSTLYVDANSALAFDDLHTSDGVPHTEMSLLTGTATLHLHPAYAGETFVLKTPTDRIRTVYPNRVYERVTSYLDAVAITHLQEPQATWTKASVAAAVTVFHNNGKPVQPEGEDDPAAFTAWDAWVADRVSQHEAAIADVAAASGLPITTPGLADMENEGVFYKCEYGTCWEPASADEDAQIAPVTPVGQGPEFQPNLRPSTVSLYAGDKTGTKVSAVNLMGFADPVAATAALPQGFTCVTVCDGQLLPGEILTMQFQSAPDVPLGLYQIPVTMISGPLTHVIVLKVYVVPVEEADFAPINFPDAPDFPCYPGGVGRLRGRAPRGIGHYGGARSYAWGVCHAGTWIYRRHVYVWVAGQRKHHHPPCRPVRCRGKVCWVPLHPKDEKGKLPVNWKHVVYRPIDKKSGRMEALTLKPKEVVEPIDDGPKEYLELPVLALPRADAPVLRVLAMKDRGVGTVVAHGTELRFDHVTHGFVQAHEVSEKGKTRVVTETFEERRATVRSTSGGASGHAGPGARGVAHAGGGGSHAGGGGAHASASHAGGGGGHASAPAAHAAAPAAHH